MKRTVKILFAMMALSLTNMPIFSMDREEEEENEEQSLVDTSSGTKRKAGAAGGEKKKTRRGTPTTTALVRQDASTQTDIDPIIDPILACYAQTILEALQRGMIDTRTGETLLHLLTARDTAGEALLSFIGHSTQGTLQTHTNFKNKLGVTALIQAINLGNENCIKILAPLTDLRNPLVVGGRKTTYLHLACQQSNAQIFDTILTELMKQCSEAAYKKAALSLKDANDLTVAEVALFHRKYNYLKALTQLPDCNVDYLLHQAITTNNYEGFTTLIDPGILTVHPELISTIDTGNTVLHTAARALEKNGPEFFTDLVKLSFNEEIPSQARPNMRARNKAAGKTAINLIANAVTRAELIKQYPTLDETSPAQQWKIVAFGQYLLENTPVLTMTSFLTFPISFFNSTPSTSSATTIVLDRDVKDDKTEEDIEGPLLIAQEDTLTSTSNTNSGDEEI
ncbi:ankyrin repeat domain-containing protein [Candidatus Dependentiae bacterium]|nr:ankyrin repeat domain-containing protein [Candidatus Dependentiae bacterium]